jgi:hypothetical protein
MDRAEQIKSLLDDFARMIVVPVPVLLVVGHALMAAEPGDGATVKIFDLELGLRGASLALDLVSLFVLLGILRVLLRLHDVVGQAPEDEAARTTLETCSALVNPFFRVGQANPAGWMAWVLQGSTLFLLFLLFTLMVELSAYLFDPRYALYLLPLGKQSNADLFHIYRTYWPGLLLGVVKMAILIGIYEPIRATWQLLGRDRRLLDRSIGLGLVCGLALILWMNPHLLRF